MKTFFTLILSFFITISVFSQSKSYYFIQAQNTIELQVADSITNITWEKQNVSGDFDILSSAQGNVYAAPTESGTYRVLYHASCGDIISDSIEVVVYDTITDVINYTQVGAHHFYKSGVSPKEMKALEFEAADLLQAGYNLENMALGGYLLEEFRTAGVSDAELTTAGIIGSITDTDGKIYTWVQIGEQIWMAQNMAYSCTTKAECRGDECIPTDIKYSAETGQYYYALLANPFGGGTSYYVDCGHKACPAGWHVPNEAEWNELFTIVGYDFSSGGINIDTQCYQTDDCTDFSGQSAPLFIGGGSGLNLDYNHGLMYSTLQRQGEVVAYQTSTFHGGYTDFTVVYFTQLNEATNYTPQIARPLVRCIKD